MISGSNLLTRVEKLKLIIKNMGIVLGSVISWIDNVDSVLRLIVTLGTIITIILTIDKLWRERSKRKT